MKLFGLKEFLFIFSTWWILFGGWWVSEKNLREREREKEKVGCYMAKKKGKQGVPEATNERSKQQPKNIKIKAASTI